MKWISWMVVYFTNIDIHYWPWVPFHRTIVVLRLILIANVNEWGMRSNSVERSHVYDVHDGSWFPCSSAAYNKIWRTLVHKSCSAYVGIQAVTSVQHETTKPKKARYVAQYIHSCNVQRILDFPEHIQIWRASRALDTSRIVQRVGNFNSKVVEGSTFNQRIQGSNPGWFEPFLSL